MSKNRGPVNKNSMEGIALVDPPIWADRWWSPLMTSSATFDLPSQPRFCVSRRFSIGNMFCRLPFLLVLLVFQCTHTFKLFDILAGL